VYQYENTTSVKTVMDHDYSTLVKFWM